MPYVHRATTMLDFVHPHYYSHYYPMVWKFDIKIPDSNMWETLLSLSPK